MLDVKKYPSQLPKVQSDVFLFCPTKGQKSKYSQFINTAIFALKNDQNLIVCYFKLF